MNLQDILNNLFGRNQNTQTIEKDRSVSLNVIGAGSTATKDYTKELKTNRKLASQIYHNLNKNYALAAQLVKPIINNNVNFIGIPTITGNKKVEKLLEEIDIDYRKVHKELEIQGDVFVWPQWDNKKNKIKLVYIPIDVIDEIYIDPLTKEEIGYKLVEKIAYAEPGKDRQVVEITHIVTVDYVIRAYVGAITKIEKIENPFGILPIVHFSNDRDISDLYGHSEFEAVMPQLKFYHELTYEAGAAQKRDGHPKLKVTTPKVKQWVENNFGKGTYEKVIAGETALNMADRDLYLNNEGEDVNYLYLNKTSGDYQMLAETTFTNIVEGSETPEINFGANIGTSLASVKEYRPVWIKKIESKQYERTEPWLMVYDVIIAIHNYVNFKAIKNTDIKLVWPRPNFASIKEQSEIVSAFATAIDKLMAKNVVTKEEVYNTLVKLDIFEMFTTYKQHEDAIDKEVQDAENKKDGASQGEEGTDQGGAEETSSDEEGSDAGSTNTD